MNTLNYKKMALSILDEYAFYLVELKLHRLYGSERKIPDLIIEMVQSQATKWFTRSSIRLLELRHTMREKLHLDRMITAYSLETPERAPGIDDFKEIDFVSVLM